MFGYTEDQAKYAAFVQQFIEVQDELNGVIAEMEEYAQDGEKVPEELNQAYKRQHFLWEMFVKEGADKYGKLASQLYKEGWDYWHHEDRILRGQRYGK